MKLRKRYLPVAAVLGVAVLGVAVLGAAVSPVLAGASVVQLEVNQNCVDPEWQCWTTELSALKPQPALTVKIAAGDEIMFTDHEPSSKTAAAVVWTSTPPSSCTGVPTTAMINWTGKCTFATSGTYKFESSTLFEEPHSLYGNNINYRKYEIVVAGTPADATTSASGETQTEAMLNGSINPEGNTVEYHFEYGSGSVTEHTTSVSMLTAANSTSNPVSAQVTGLQPGMTYHFELVASYGGGKTVSGGPQTFTTPAATEPTASTLAASASKETEATLNGKVDPKGGAEAEYFFEWGAGSDESYEHTTKVVGLPSDGAEHQVSATVTDLTPGSEYHFRLVAKNKLGSVQGKDLALMTASTPPTKEPTREPSPTPTPAGGNPPTATTSSPPSSGQPKSEPVSGPLFGSLKLASTQHGGVVHGSLVVSSAGSEGELQIELLTKGAAVPAGKLVRSSLHAGKLTFALPLSAKAKHTLKAHHRLTLTVKIVLTPKHGAAMTLTRSVVVR